jgi:hypothetical protein
MPPEPNSVRAARPSRTVLVIAMAAYAFMVFGGLVLFAFGAARGVNAVRIAVGPTVATTASVIDRDVENGDLKVYYAFQPPGSAASYVGIENVTSVEYAAAEDGAPVDVEYLTSDPNTNWIVGHSPVAGEVLAAALGVLLGVFVLGVTQWRFGIRGVRALWRASRFP